MSKKDNRLHHRVLYSGQARIAWEDEQGLTRFAHAKCIDVSQGGLRIEAAERIPLLARISLRADRINLSGSATVRNVGWRGCKYILGLNLSQTQPAEVLALVHTA
jgi:PilZ domain